MITIRIGVLGTAAKDWEDMAGGFEDLETLYAAKVESVATDGSWVGVSAGVASGRFAATRQQFANAQVEARAIASLLRDAQQQFSRLIGQVKDLVEEAKKAELYVNSKGEAIYDFSKLTPMRHDPDYPTYVSKWKEAEASWTKAIRRRTGRRRRGPDRQTCTSRGGRHQGLVRPRAGPPGTAPRL